MCRQPAHDGLLAQRAGGRRDPAVLSDPPIDCFYVYPTVSSQPALNASKDKDAELHAVARQQAQSFSQLCRVYAPVYRQRTVLGIYLAGPAQQAAALRIAYADVREAWREYLARENAGRGFVLVGHSQGSRMLRRLIREEIDGAGAVRRRLVAAVIPGGNVLVRKGRRDGGDFANVPACSAEAETGCVHAWSAFGDPPPGDTRFGRSPAADPSAELPTGADYEVLCTNPASLAANARAPLRSIYRPELFPGPIGVSTLRVFNLMAPLSDTPWVVPAERYSGRCEQVNGANILMVAPLDGAQKLSPAPDDTWGLHLIDVNLVLGDAVAAVARQTAAYEARPASRARLILHYKRGRDGRGRSCARSAVRVVLAGAEGVTRMTVRVSGRHVATDRRAPFTVSISRRRLRRGVLTRIEARLARRGLPGLRLTRTVLGC